MKNPLCWGGRANRVQICRCGREKGRDFMKRLLVRSEREKGDGRGAMVGSD